MERYWNLIKEYIYFEDGSLRDIFVYNTSREDCITFLGFISKNYKVYTRSYLTNEESNCFNLKDLENYWNGELEGGYFMNFELDGITVAIHLFSDEEIEMDIDPREIQKIEDHELVISVMQKISSLLGKEVLMTLESSPEIQLLKVNGNSLEYL